MNFFKTSLLLASMTALFMGLGYLLGGVGGLLIALVFALATNAFAYWQSDKLVLRMHNARLVNQRSHPGLYDMTQKLARNADLPMPALYVIDQPQPNAFATGRDPNNAAVAVTTGIMQALSEQELAGVIAHELAHIKNRDTLTMTIAATLAGALAMLAQFAQFGLMFRGSSDRDRSGLGIIAVIAAMILAPLAASLVQMAISRTREYSADALGAEICRHPLWLASALRKIEALASGYRNEAAERNPASAHMFIINPLTAGGIDNLFATHPKTANRIAALERLAQSTLGPATGPAEVLQGESLHGSKSGRRSRFPSGGRSYKD